MSLVAACLLGLVEGITEFLPVSSTGHVLLASRLMGLAQTEALKTFEIAVQCGAILAVVCLYGREFLLRRDVLLRVLAAFVPTAVLGFLLHDLVRNVFFDSTSTVIGALLLGGVALLVFERSHRGSANATEDLSTLPFTVAVAIGFFQSLALVPGVSRSAATIVGGLLLGVSRPAIVRFSFLLAVPTIGAASLFDVWKSAAFFTPADARALALGGLVSFLVALAVIRWFLAFVRAHSFAVFGWYRIALGTLLLVWVSTR